MAFKINNKIVNKHLIHLVQHGINSEMFKKLDSSDKRIKDKKKHLFGDKIYDFVLFHNSRNVQRKKTSNTVLAYRMFCDSLPKEQAKKCVLVMHTESIQEPGTDLYAVIKAVCPEYDVIIDESKMSPEDMCAMYNIADVTILISSNEGFGLSIAESIMCETPVIVNVTGGLQDQIGQVDENGDPVKFNDKFTTNTRGKYKKHGIWAKPVWPVVQTLQGSPPTPYIFDDICTWEDTAEAIMYWYLMDKKDRELCGKEGRRWSLNEGGLNAKNMCNQFINAMDFTLNNFMPPSKVTLYTDADFIGHAQPNNSIGFEIPKVDLNKIKEDINKTKEKIK